MRRVGYLPFLGLALLTLVEARTSHRPGRIWGPNEFPPGFYLGAATSAYQVEGAWNEDGKGENIWDYMFHNHPNKSADGNNGDVTDDSYHKYSEDINALLDINANCYRFSISWARILPTGDTDKINQEGIDYYNKLIDSVVAKNITPLVTIYHFDLPQELQKLGGWPNIVLADYLLEYARILFDNFGDRVKLWITFNEPNMFSNGYSGADIAPGANSSGIADYLLAKTVLLAHAKVWHLYDEQYRSEQGGRVGITLDIGWYEPLTSSADDAEASERKLMFEAGLWAHPIFTNDGDFPEIVKIRVGTNSKAEGRKRSRLPELTREEIEYIRGSADFMGINYYSSYAVTSGTEGTIPSKDYDTGVVTSNIDGYNYSFWVYDIPWGLRKTLNWVHHSYPGYPLFITENGWADPPGVLNDTGRIHYYNGHISAILKAVNEDGVPVIGYTPWSLIDNLEWNNGYTVRFGIFSVDFDDPERPRTAKASAAVIADIYKNRRVPLDVFEAADTEYPS